MFKNLFQKMTSKVMCVLFGAPTLYGAKAIRKYSHSFKAKSNDELLAIVAHERHVRGWVSERAYYLEALHRECQRRGIS